MISKALLRSALVLAIGLGVASCQNDTTVSLGLKHQRPLPPATLALMAQKGMDKSDPILVRAFKEESTLEIWKRDRSGKFALLKSYKMCAWGGTLGPKIKEGDKQSPEGFYSVTPGRMNPNSQFYLSYDIGYPNAFDRAFGRTGAAVMVHGGCTASAGCFVMTDEQVAEIYALAREALAGGQKSIQVQAFPFRMTAENLAKHRKSPNMGFWKNIKQGYDHFEVAHLPPKVDVCEKRYVFDAQPKATTSSFNAAGACPAYEVPRDIATAVAAKEAADDQAFRVAVADLDAQDRRPTVAPDKPRTSSGTQVATWFGGSPAATPASETMALAEDLPPIDVPLPKPSPLSSTTVVASNGSAPNGSAVLPYGAGASVPVPAVRATQQMSAQVPVAAGAPAAPVVAAPEPVTTASTVIAVPPAPAPAPEKPMWRRWMSFGG